MEITRREFLTFSAFVGGAALFHQAVDILNRVAGEDSNRYTLSEPERMIFTVCQQCNTQCGIKVKQVDGVAVKIDGNPYSPWALYPHVPYATPVRQMAKVDGWICPKGHAGIQTAYDPYRIRKVLKRKPGTKRGENQWVTIPFEQAIREIVEGGDLFGEGPVPGLKDLWAIRDPQVMKEMGDFVKKIWAEKDPEKKSALVAEFKEKFADHMAGMIDPDHPDLGPKNNQVVLMWGRLKGARSDFLHRFFGSGLGTVNRHGHTTVCQGSLYFACKAMSEQFVDGKFSGGSKFYWLADLGNSEFVIFIGANIFEGNYGPPLRVPKVTDGLSTGRLRYAVIDPRFGKTAARAWKWVPNKPGTEGAIPMGMIRWIVENGRYDERYLRNANKAAADAAGEPTWTNAVWLVKIADDGTPGAFLRASEVGLTTKQEVEKEGKKVTVYVTPEGKEYPYDLLVTMVEGQPVAFDPNDAETPVVGDLFVDTSLQGGEKPIRVKSGMQILKESMEKMTIEEYAAEAGIRPEDIVDLAREFTSHGKRVATDIHRGVSQHTNGFYNVTAWFTLNLLIGNYDWTGGLIKDTKYDYVGKKAKGPFELDKMNPGAISPFGISITRHGVKWQTTTLYDGNYPARRNWYPLADAIYQEIIPSIGDAYPYPVQFLFIYMGSPVYALPAGHTNIEILRDPRKIPLIVASDITIGETTMYADYIFPDVTYLERWEMGGSHGSVPWKVQPLRQPAIPPLTETVKVYGQEMPLCVEAVLLGLAEALGLPNFGPDGLGEGVPFTHPDHLYLRMVANLAFGEKEDGADAVPDADDDEVAIFMKARDHLPRTVFDADRWKGIVGEELWRKVVFVLNRGGRFQEFEKGYKGQQVANKYGKLINLYQEKTATTKSAMTGKPLVGYATYIPAPLDMLGNPLEESPEYNLRLITYREIFHTKTRTISNYWLLGVAPENYVLLNAQDAARLGLREGDLVKVVSPDNPDGVWDLGNGQKKPMVGKVRVIQGIRPGVVAFSLGHGHWAYGASDVTVDGQVIPGDPRRATGIHANAAMRVDPYLKNTCLADPVGGSAVFYDSWVKLVRV